ncbi:hypothetical protein EV138_3931 [Kribbella voronezhensis]|uniref:Uncharacterized protein n=1 Tax=Kribbella voronezhensis TaxID=2512212 RepID=A0A4R7TE08_9ACTN|nr:hypothetical protein [Kribbella voronezhensis]TDU90345.1 hypothetical protein EV138_3931 [Kribbella voronezhensis]
MSKVVVADIDTDGLGFAAAFSDRYVYSNYFVPVLITFDDEVTPILPFYAKQQLLEALRYGGLDRDRLPGILKKLGLSRLWDANNMDAADENLPYTDSTMVFAERPQSRPTILGSQETEFVAGLLQSDLGYAFLDRTRIRPAGFALGEHLYALALAPGEEVVLEQKTYTKRQLTLEEQDETERQFDVELTSSLSTELQEGFERQRSLTDSWGLNASHTGEYHSPEFFWGKFNASHTIAYTKNVTDAHQETARRAVKDNQTASSKVAAKYRTQHKTDFKLVTESGFESTSKRTLRNPNRITPITLHYFKVLQRLQLQQERYGARLCWAPSIKDPANTFFGRILKGREAIMAAATAALPPIPQEPKKTEPAAGPTPTTPATQVNTSAVVPANQWGWTGDMRADYDIDVPFDSGALQWDDDADFIEQNINVITRRPQETVSRYVVGTPYPTSADGGSVLRVRVHIGCPSWLGGPGIELQLKARFREKSTIVQQVGEDTKYNADLAAYRTALQAWNDKRDAALEQAHADADALELRMKRGLEPVNEMISQIIEQRFPAGVRDECWEIDYWQRIFDWERASFVAYPSWWSTGDSREPTLDPSDFINASWAKLYLPVRAGMELFALRWIFGKSVAAPLGSVIEKQFERLIEDLRKFRGTIIGEPDEVPDLTTDCQDTPEKVYCVAHWAELMPTDGTHLEIVQGATSAADAVTSQEITDAEAMRAALLAAEKQAGKLKDRAWDQMTEPAELEVHIGTPPSAG